MKKSSIKSLFESLLKEMPEYGGSSSQSFYDYALNEVQKLQIDNLQKYRNLGTKLAKLAAEDVMRKNQSGDLDGLQKELLELRAEIILWSSMTKQEEKAFGSAFEQGSKSALDIANKTK